MKEIFRTVLNMSLTGSAVILLVMAARLALKRTPKIFSYALWGVVLFRLLCPVSLSSSVSLLGWLKPEVTAPTAVTSTVSYIPSAPTRQETAETVPPSPGEAPTAVKERDAEAPDLLMVGACIWAIGAAAMAGYSLAQYLRFRGKLAGAVSLGEGVYLSDSIDTPFVMGVLRPGVYLPSGLAPEEREFILAHERQHIRRGDPAWKLLGYMALCIHWFNPLVWAAFVLASRDMEMSCDEAVVKKLGAEIRADYATALLRLATHRKRIAGMPLAFGEGDPKGRIQNMARWKQPRWWVRIVCAVLCLAILIACGFNPRQAEAVTENGYVGVEELYFRLPAGYTFAPQEDGGEIFDGTNVVGGVMTFPVPENLDGWDWLETLDLWEWSDVTLGYYADRFSGDRYTLEFFSDVPEGEERTVLRVHNLFVGEDRLYDIWFDELTTETAFREGILNSLSFGAEPEPFALSALPYEIGTLPEGYTYEVEPDGSIRFTDGSNTVGGITGYKIPEGVYDPYDDAFLWLEDVGIPDYEDSTLVFWGGITIFSGGWKATFASNVPEGAEITVMRTHYFRPCGDVVYDFWLDELLLDNPSQFAFEDAVRCTAPAMEQEAPETAEDLAFAKCQAVMDLGQSGCIQIRSEYQFDTDSAKNYTLDSYWNDELGFLSIPDRPSAEHPAMLYSNDRFFTAEGAEHVWKEEAGFDSYTGPWLSSFNFIRKYVTYIDTLESAEGQWCMFRVDAPYDGEEGAEESYFVEFLFDDRDNFVKVQIHVNSFREDAVTITESIVTMDADTVTARIEAEYQTAIG